MNNSDVQGGATLISVASDNAAKKVGEKAADRALNAIIDFVKSRYGETKVRIGSVFDRYLENAMLRYNQVRTLATGTTTRSIIGDDSLYVSIGVKYNDQEIDTISVDSMLQVSKNILILGTGGVGKSMLTRYLFLVTAEYEDYVPVLIELRRIGTQSPGQLSIMDLIYDCMKDFDVELPVEQFEYSLRLGKYLFLFDGFDEVKSSLAKETAAAIQTFSAKYPQNSFIVTSRPRTETSPLETFTVMESMLLSKEQAVDLASRIWTEDEKTREFCQQLDAALYERHKDFAENPLLLSMMFLTFMRNSSIPDHLSDFYKKAYEALYSAHDNQDKGYYKRDFECKTLDENEFKRVLSHFCFKTYFKETYEFAEDEILEYLQASLQKLKFDDVKAKDYLTDLRNVVCMIVKDGDTYRFSHRSFQAYFAACYTAYYLTDEQQKRLFAEILSKRETYHEKVDYYALLIQIEFDRFAENALEDGLRRLLDISETTQFPDEFFLKTLYYNAIFVASITDDHYIVDRLTGFGIAHKDGSYYDYNVICLFDRYIKVDSRKLNQTTTQFEQNVIEDYVNSVILPKLEGQGEFYPDKRKLYFEDIDNSDDITDSERQHFYSLLVEGYWGNGIHDRITEWLEELDAKRLSLKSSSFIDDL